MFPAGMKIVVDSILPGAGGTEPGIMRGQVILPPPSVNGEETRVGFQAQVLRGGHGWIAHDFVLSSLAAFGNRIEEIRQRIHRVVSADPETAGLPFEQAFELVEAEFFIVPDAYPRRALSRDQQERLDAGRSPITRNASATSSFRLRGKVARNNDKLMAFEFEDCQIVSCDAV